MTKLNGFKLNYRVEKLARRYKAYADCLARPHAWNHGKWTGEDLREIRARKGVGRPSRNAA